MTKCEFLLTLQEKLSGLPLDEVEERIAFYSEMIEDRMEEGLPEEESVAAAGDTDAIAAQIAAELSGAESAKAAERHTNEPLSNAPNEEKIPTADGLHTGKNAPQEKKGVWTGILLVLGSPLWLALLLTVFAVALAVYITLWAVLISLWAVFAAVEVCALAGVVAGIVWVLGSNRFAGFVLLGAGLVCAGVTILLFYGCRAVTVGFLQLTRKAARGIKRFFGKKEGTY